MEILEKEQVTDHKQGKEIEESKDDLDQEEKGDHTEEIKSKDEAKLGVRGAISAHFNGSFGNPSLLQRFGM